MPYTKDLDKLLDEGFVDQVTEFLVNSDIQYLYPYDLKLFIIKYATIIKTRS